MFSSLKETAKSLKESATKNTEELLTKKGAELFNEQYKKVEPLIINGLLGIAEEKLKDDAFLERYLEKAYEILPAPIRLLVTRNKFIEITIKQKTPLLQKVEEIKEKRNDPVLITKSIEDK